MLDSHLLLVRIGRSAAKGLVDIEPSGVFHSIDLTWSVGRIVRNDYGRAYVENADASTNQVESFFSRVRRAEIGIHHRIAGKYLDRYAAELAWREDRRRTDPRRMAKL